MFHLFLEARRLQVKEKGISSSGSESSKISTEHMQMVVENLVNSQNRPSTVKTY